MASWEEKKRLNSRRWMEAQMNGEPWKQSRFFGYSIENLKYLHQPVTVRWTEPTWNREEWEAKQARQTEPAGHSPEAEQDWRMAIRSTINPVTGEIEEREFLDRSGPVEGAIPSEEENESE